MKMDGCLCPRVGENLFYDQRLGGGEIDKFD